MRSSNKYFKTYAQERITIALLDLMSKDRFDDITIQEITQRAGVSRRAFYVHYKTKADVLDGYYDVLAKQYYASIPAGAKSDYKAQALLFFTFWKQHGAYLDVLQRNDMTHMLFRKFESYLMDMSGTSVEEGAKRYYSSFFAGGLWATLIAWVRGGFEESPAELAEAVSKFEALDMFDRFPE